ncbi:sigma-70 family RNA polymerase sigma factor [Pseudoalteromonas piscicida]|nr:sigma-70 family RNA polymerase sigma factor [Pseudoalteromonas piscicida]
MSLSTYKRAVSIISRRTGCKDKAQNIIQEAIARLIKQGRNKAQQHSTDNLDQALILKTANNLLVDLYRRNNVCSFTALPEEESPLFEQAHLNPESKLIAQQEYERLERCIADLPPKCREAFVLHKYKGLNQSQIATHMQISQSMVEKHIIKAMKRCREVLLEE